MGPGISNDLSLPPFVELDRGSPKPDPTAMYPARLMSADVRYQTRMTANLHAGMSFGHTTSLLASPSGNFGAGTPATVTPPRCGIQRQPQVISNTMQWYSDACMQSKSLWLRLS
ncbi:predicted protein [Chaetomium globosum CBS 148.51]|uniref:Uncharacterized protein n=1 Tax=Chaetomium globosum (strain ATCC 6205 / CBS 148.51 / DSM 1962 / NBRC 6347 / NRRL 1970) TaxID=306901 RepID=Q2GWA3_CHAGB|nr:uncharacterized protein CHGG_07751 [Chaetomium globosum CBS 148.51]EAQ86498.1 predicted protein [Chaetomium globosum CBS 148.51]